MRRAAGVACCLLVTAVVAGGRQKPSLADLKTTAEASGFKSTSSYDDVVKFMKAVDEASPIVFYTTYGTTTEGRQLPLAIVGTGLKDGSPASVKASNKLRVHIQANVHAGEVEGKESALILLRELALGQHADWLQSSVFLITPDYNADGNEKFGNNRGIQNGPINGEGTRANAQGLNINRDYMKLDTPEAKAFVKLWNDYDPHIFAAAQPRHESGAHEDHDGRMVPVRHEADQGKTRLGHVLLRQRVRGGRPGARLSVAARRWSAFGCGCGCRAGTRPGSGPARAVSERHPGAGQSAARMGHVRARSALSQ
jgi:hypothetical protein